MGALNCTYSTPLIIHTLTHTHTHTCRNMITIDAHSRDMVQSVIESQADKVDCFQWVCQLRSYWDSTINDCRIKICDASFPYGYEYLGNGARLVRGTDWSCVRMCVVLCVCWVRVGESGLGC